MNDLLSRSFSAGRNGDIEMGNAAGDDGTNLDKFFEDVEAIKEELKGLELLHDQLQSSNEESKTVHNAKSIKTLRTKMDNDVALSLKKAKLIKNRLESLDRSNSSNRNLPGCGPGSSTDRTRTSVVNGLRNQFQTSMKSFNELRQKMAAEHRETVQRRTKRDISTEGDSAARKRTGAASSFHGYGGVSGASGAQKETEEYMKVDLFWNPSVAYHHRHRRLVH
ncbi:hypothetical protein L2E82_17038 [Cichorium intybus]|uniref:Uncharacterized protein n=1 Tax=Cichorium intybus TaxID=13427 RepID=A0ACB9F754_CICIN|nr:hypothetical protein L2E82_17038 [Cichorium intybus]